MIEPTGISNNGSTSEDFNEQQMQAIAGHYFLCTKEGLNTVVLGMIDREAAKSRLGFDGEKHSWDSLWLI